MGSDLTYPYFQRLEYCSKLREKFIICVSAGSIKPIILIIIDLLISSQAIALDMMDRVVFLITSWLAGVSGNTMLAKSFEHK